MILIDPDLDPYPAPRNSAVSPLSARPRTKPPWPQRIPTKPTLTRFLTEAQQAVRLRGEVTVLLTTDAAIRRLNRQFRGKNKPTDVLSFPAQGIGAAEIAGDVAISVETARRQAADQGHALTCELKVLILHGLLHLAGHDHETDTGQMVRREQKLRAILRLSQGLIERTESPKKDAALKGHGFSRAKRATNRGAALAAEGMHASEKRLPQQRSPGAPSFPRLLAERVGNHNLKPSKQKPTPSRSARP
jgi:probable rRNA maturation factor